MPASAAGALAELLDVTPAEPEPKPPRTLEGARGTLERGDTAAMARADLGLEGAPLPPQGTAERRAYESRKRRYERYTTTAGERRGSTAPGDMLDRILERARERTAERRHAWRDLRARLRVRALNRMRRDGFSMHLTAVIRVSRTVKIAHMPAGAGSTPGFQRIPSEGARPVADAWGDGDREGAGAEALNAFFAAYWTAGSAVAVTEIVDVRCRW